MTERERQMVLERARGCCEYCQSQMRYATQRFSIEHIQPKAKGGQDNLQNLALSCQGCNNHKFTRTEARDPMTNLLVPLYQPREQAWLEHFAWNEDFVLVIGLTPTGRATVDALQLNRDGVVNLRRALHALGEHPPVFD
jgi:HNH endonuclease